jgi:hypothetical protein
MMVMDTEAPKGINPKKGTNPINAIRAISMALTVKF